MTTKQSSKRFQARWDHWRQLVAQQEQSGLGVRTFCAQHGLREQPFYQWRKRLRGSRPVSFALVDTPETGPKATWLELYLAGGERLAIGAGVDAATLRRVLQVLRERA